MSVSQGSCKLDLGSCYLRLSRQKSSSTVTQHHSILKLIHCDNTNYFVTVSRYVQLAADIKTVSSFMIILLSSSSERMTCSVKGLLLYVERSHNKRFAASTFLLSVTGNNPAY